jgi:hypothetical protein
MSGNKKDISKLLILLRKQGWEIRRNRQGHWMCLNPDGVRKFVLPASIGSPNSYLNAVTGLRRAGASIPRATS